jgi:hypothetical protein
MSKRSSLRLLTFCRLSATHPKGPSGRRSSGTPVEGTVQLRRCKQRNMRLLMAPSWPGMQLRSESRLRRLLFHT